ncbi:uncharacterized protein LOC132271905 [Cornus florida]|uniref:uncharacterized protein LOC132271905 n=1 Tax=Cornus florida TaxID=4283 RepID=UPI00289F0F4D|nr:uncharacterized protein LOC132271905 [Cornus florida]
MGREWLYWGGGSGSGRSTKKGRGVERESSSSSTTTTPSGCMSAVLQLFDFHLFHQFALHQQQPPSFKPDSFLPDEPTILKGVEAPRNSLETQEPFMGAINSLLISTMKGDIPMGIQIKTRTDDLSSEYSSSPGTKTPNLVARLMGLDLLPENSSPSLSTSSNHSTSKPHLQQESHSQRLRSSGLDTNIVGTRSLPETPRMSSERRSDVDHRLSLQINKENIGISEEIEVSRSRRRDMKLEEEIKSPSQYARQIVKQVRESVGRKVGLDITNYTTRNRDEHDVLRRKKQVKASLAKLGDESNPSKQSTPSCSPRLRFMEAKNRTVTSTVSTENQNSHNPKCSSSPSSTSSLININQSKPSKVSWKPKHEPLQVQRQQNSSIQKCEKASTERFARRLKKPLKASDSIRNKQEEPFVRALTTNRANQSDNKCKKTPLPSEIFSVKKDPSPPATKLPQKQYSQADTLPSKSSTQLSSYSYKQETTHRPTIQENSIHDRSRSASAGDGEEFQYISRILKRTGIDASTPVSYTKWYTPSRPLDPSLFHHLELTTTAATKLRQRPNRKLIFELVNEVLVEVLKPYVNLKPWVVTGGPDREMNGSELIDRVWTKIKGFPLADCRVLEDIDKLIDLGSCDCELEEEGESIVSEIERDVTEWLVHETAMVVWNVRTTPGGRRTRSRV